MKVWLSLHLCPSTKDHMATQPFFVPFELFLIGRFYKSLDLNFKGIFEIGDAGLNMCVFCCSEQNSPALAAVLQHLKGKIMEQGQENVTKVHTSMA